MSAMLLLIAAVVAFAVAWWWLRRPARPSSVPHAAAQRTAAPVAPAPAATATRPVVTLTDIVSEPPPPALATFNWQREDQLDSTRRQQLLEAVRGIPRPPRSMQQLLSPEFLTKASSADLSELVMGEPLIAAKVLSTVNSPFYGLQSPVNSIGQAVTFLGINSVRGICLQYMLAEAFKPTLAEAQKAFDAIWKASAMASELAVRLGKALNLPDQSSLSTQVVLSFVGQLATASLLPAAGLSQWLQRDRLERAGLEQELLGLSAAEIGPLLMKSWDLPAGLIADVGDSARLLVTPPSRIDPARLPRLALAYLCARLGERLALRQLHVLDGYRPEEDMALDMHHLRASLAHPLLAPLGQALQSPELLAAVRLMLSRPNA